MLLKKTRILWTDDEIDSLHAHIIFLEEKGFDVVTANNGTDAIEIVKNDFFDIIFLDENMPGLSGLQTLNEITSAQSECSGSDDYQKARKKISWKKPSVQKWLIT